jgi:hypothetical protein
MQDVYIPPPPGSQTQSIIHAAFKVSKSKQKTLTLGYFMWQRNYVFQL